MSAPGRRRWAVIALVMVAAGGCLALGWWQWTRYESASGTFQNLGYALQWPFFAGFCIYAYRRFIRLEDNPDEQQQHSDAPVEIPAGLLPERPAPARADTVAADDDPALRDYNAYLAQLARDDALAAHHEPAPNEKQDRTTA